MNVSIVNGRVEGYETTVEFAKRCSVCMSTVQEWIQNKKIQVLTIGRDHWIKIGTKKPIGHKGRGPGHYGPMEPNPSTYDCRTTALKTALDGLRELVEIDYRAVYNSDTIPRMSPQKHRAIVAVAMNAFYKGLFNGATKEEVTRLATYALVCVDAAKHYLNYKQCRIDMNIDELMNKYGPKGENE
ncbi:MAG: hypothetical protein IJT28_08215 [Bacteroidaceae bacterium]|nr:hypothetical protein [Bacteroidaceae bacterium]